jgi:hypothetical protein
MAKTNGLEVDRRVGIALSVLPPSQRTAVERIMRSSPSFTRAATAPGRVQQMRTSGQPLYMMRVSPGLRLIYTTVGDTVYVVDLVERATLNHFAARKNAKKVAKALAKKRVPKAAAQKAPDPVER